MLHTKYHGSRPYGFRQNDIFIFHKNEINRQTMIHARTEYKNTVRKFNLAQDRLKTSKLLHAKLKNAKEYWKMLKESVKPSKPKRLSVDNFDVYFKAINNPEDYFFSG